METQALSKTNVRMPFLLEDYFKPWNEWLEGDLWGKTMNVPSVNITEHENHYLVSLAAPGLKKSDFKIDVTGNILTISSEKQESKEEKEKKFTRKEYSYTSFSRSFTIPETVNTEKIEAAYENGVLTIALPLKEETPKATAKQIAVN